MPNGEINISVSGTRTSPSEWDAVRDMSEAELPRLSPEQRAVAQELGIPEADYARSAFAGQRAQEKLLAKVEMFARLLNSKIRAHDAEARLESVTLETWEERYDVIVALGGRRVPWQIAEDVVDALFERGESEEKLDRIVERMLGAYRN